MAESRPEGSQPDRPLGKRGLPSRNEHDGDERFTRTAYPLPRTTPLGEALHSNAFRGAVVGQQWLAARASPPRFSTSSAHPAKPPETSSTRKRLWGASSRGRRVAVLVVDDGVAEDAEPVDL